MKHFLPTSLAVFALILSACTSTNTTLYQYPFESAKIEYNISGTTTGTSITLIKGDKLAREVHITLKKDGGEQKQDNLHIENGENIYDIDLAKKTGTMTINPLYAILQKTSPQDRRELLNKITLGMSPDEAIKRNITIIGTQNVAGQPCDVYDTGGFGIICLWNSIPLKTSLSLPEFGLNNNNVATTIQTNIDVPDSTFEVPAGIAIQKIQP